MMKQGIVLAVVVATGLSAAAGAPVVSGPQAGDKVPGPFKPLNVTGPDAGQEECLYCKNGPKPVVMVFARELTPAVVSLVKKLDAAAAAHDPPGLAACVILLSDDRGAAPALSRWAAGERLANTVLAIYAAAGPEKYKMAPDAAVTVVLYVKQKVRANHAFRPGELTPQAAEAVLADLPKILPAK